MYSMIISKLSRKGIFDCQTQGSGVLLHRLMSSSNNAKTLLRKAGKVVRRDVFTFFFSKSYLLS